MELNDKFISPGNPPPYTEYPVQATAAVYPGQATAAAYPGQATTTTNRGAATAPAYPGPTTVQPAPQMGGVAGSGPVITMVYDQRMGPDPTPMVCRICGVQIITRLELKSSTKTHICAAVLCVFGCWPCVPIPYCTNTFKNAHHYCPHCTAYIGTYIN